MKSIQDILLAPTHHTGQYHADLGRTSITAYPNSKFVQLNVEMSIGCGTRVMAEGLDACEVELRRLSPACWDAYVRALAEHGYAPMTQRARRRKAA